MKEEWRVKQSFALIGKMLTDSLLSIASQDPESVTNAIDVYNTSSISAMELVTIPINLSAAGDLVKDIQENKIVSQRLSLG